MLVKTITFKHPDWDMSLTLTDDGNANRIVRDNYLGDSDPTLLTSEPGEMLRSELDALPEWDG